MDYARFLIKELELIKQKLYEHVGFVEDWKIYPITNRTDMYWQIITDEEEVKYHESKEELNSNENYYVDEIYQQRFYKKWIYRGEDLTMIIVDTHTHGNKFLAFFDNLLEVKEK